MANLAVSRSLPPTSMNGVREVRKNPGINQAEVVTPLEHFRTSASEKHEPAGGSKTAYCFLLSSKRRALDEPIPFIVKGPPWTSKVPSGEGILLPTASSTMKFLLSTLLEAMFFISLATSMLVSSNSRVSISKDPTLCFLPPSSAL